MPAAKKPAKSKIIPEDANELISQAQFLKDSPKIKKTQKRQKNKSFEEEDMTRLIGQYHASAKKKKEETTVDATKRPCQKILETIGHQLDSRKQCNENLFQSLSEAITQVETDYNTMKENEQKLEHLTGTYMKCIQQATTAYKQKLKALKEIHGAFKNECEEMDSCNKAETDKLVDEIEYDIKKLQDKLITDTKRSGWESLRRSIFHAMQNDI